MAPDPRVVKALRAMHGLGIRVETVKPVLKKLLKLYDGKWDLIEDDNYRTLADAIFECADDKLREDTKKEAMVYDGPEPPFKKPHLGHQEDQVSSTDGSTMLGPEEGEIRQTSTVAKLESSQSCLRERRIESNSHLLQAPIIDKGKDPISSEMAPRDKMLPSEGASPAFYSNQAVDGTGYDPMRGENSPKDHQNEEIKPKIEQFVDDLPHFAVPTLMDHSARPGSLEGSSCGNNASKCLMSHYADKNSKDDVSGSSKLLGLGIGLVTAQQQPSARDKKMFFRKISDITNGTEKVRISLLDEFGNEHLPNFVYIPQNTIYQNAFVHVSLARISDEDCCSSCMGDCLSSSVPCACARDTGGEYAYSPQGLLKEEFLRACISMNQEPQKHYNFYCQDCPLERAKKAYKPEPCKGHLVRKFIKECWRKCGCNMQCGNRVVQRGISCKLQVFLTNKGKGWGLRTLEELPKGAFVCEYIGEILTNMELYERNKGSSGNERHTYPVLLDADWGSEGILKDDDALCLDATYYGNVARFINHRCFDANLLEIPVEVETPDHHYYHLAFFTKRKVDALEELTWDYGIDFDDHNHPIKAFQCCCASAFCRDTKRRGTKSSVLPFKIPTTGGTIEQLSS